METWSVHVLDAEGIYSQGVRRNEEKHGETKFLCISYLVSDC